MTGNVYGPPQRNLKGMKHRHLSDYDLERYHLGMVTARRELKLIEEHYLGCRHCARRAEEVAKYVDALRAAIVSGDFDLIERVSTVDRKH
jgi:hypothetical protein